MSNEKQIMTAMIAYSTSNNTYLPAARVFVSWDDLITGYLGLNWSEDAVARQFLIKSGADKDLNNDVLACPSDEVQRSLSGKNLFERSYSVNQSNAWFQGNAVWNGRFPGLMNREHSIMLSKVNEPDKTVVIGEQWSNDNYCGSEYDITGGTYMKGYHLFELVTYGTQAADLYCHDKKGLANFGMADGHVERMNGKKLLEDANHAGGNDFSNSWLDFRK